MPGVNCAGFLPADWKAMYGPYLADPVKKLFYKKQSGRRPVFKGNRWGCVYWYNTWI